MLQPVLGLLALGLFALGCQESKDSGTGKTDDPNRGPDRGDEVDTEAALGDLFKSEIEFTVSELTGGKTNCDDITRRSNLENDIKPWPKELKAFLVDTLLTMPITAQVLDSVFAIYLVREDALAGSDGEPAAAGLACDRGTDYKGVLFLNYDTFVSDRKARGIGEWQNLTSVQEKFIRLESGDNAAMTLVHEALHAIDNKLYVNGLDAAARSGRSAIFDLSWVEHTQPRFDRIDLLSLTDGASRPVDSGLVRSGCGTRLKGEAPRASGPSNGLSLTDEPSPQDLVGDLRYLATKTNFIVPYAMATAAEDFAESLTIYYFGAYLDSWQTRTVYDQDVREGTEGREALYRHSTKDIASKYDDQRAKLCKMAELVFASCEL